MLVNLARADGLWSRDFLSQGRSNWQLLEQGGIDSREFRSLGL